ncbi:hypothetical protein Tco_1016004 [Tanacetum coccineum]|uniref:Uncharacterized protein n=1 Tax=Tanacetum coccineum TaxID=301880 RepID=A0ABQ5FMY9_9ASTR
MGYGVCRGGIRRIGNCEHAFTCEDLALIRNISFPGYGVLVRMGQEMLELLRIKNKELELKVAKLEIRRLENRQSDEALYESKTDEDLKAILK